MLDLRSGLRGLHPETAAGHVLLAVIMLCISTYGMMAYETGTATYATERLRNHAYPTPRMAPYTR